MSLTSLALWSLHESTHHKSNAPQWSAALRVLLDARPLSSSQLDSLGLLKARDGRTSLTMLSPICQSFTLDLFHAEVLELNLNPSAISTVDAAMPGWGLLFEEREHLLQMIHLSLREFLLDSDRSGSCAADVRRGHILLAQSCLRNLLERTTGPTLAYALRHGHVCHGLYVKSGTPARSVKFCPMSTLFTLFTLSVRG